MLNLLFPLFPSSVHCCVNLSFDGILTARSLHWTLPSDSAHFVMELISCSDLNDLVPVKGPPSSIRPRWIFMQIPLESLHVSVNENRVSSLCVVSNFINDIIHSNIHIVDGNSEKHWPRNRALWGVTSDRAPLLSLISRSPLLVCCSTSSRSLGILDCQYLVALIYCVIYDVKLYQMFSGNQNKTMSRNLITS